MSQGNPENFPRGNSNFVHSQKNLAAVKEKGGFIFTDDTSEDSTSLNQSFSQEASSLLSEPNTKISIDDINNLNLIINDNDCGNAFFHKLCDQLSDKGLQFTISKQNNNLMYENATVITLDQQMIAGEGVAFIGPQHAATANHSEALLKAMQITFEKSGWDTEAFSGVMQYVSSNSNVVYHAVPSETENVVLPDSTYVTVSFGTMPDGFGIDTIAEDLLISLARYQNYIKQNSEITTIETFDDISISLNDNHYLFHEQISEAPAFNPNHTFEVYQDAHYSK